MLRLQLLEGVCYYLKEQENLPIDEKLIREQTLMGLEEIANSMINDNQVYSSDLGSFVGKGTTRGINGMNKMRSNLSNLLLQCEDGANIRFIQLIVIFIRNNLLSLMTIFDNVIIKESEQFLRIAEIVKK